VEEEGEDDGVHLVGFEKAKVSRTSRPKRWRTVQLKRCLPFLVTPCLRTRSLPQL